MHLSKRSLGFLIGLFLITGQTLLAQRQLKAWQIFEITMEARKKYANPYTDIPVTDQDQGLVKAEFRGVSGEARGKVMTLFGFWYGGRTWKVRFAPPASGTWEYETFSPDKGLNKVKGNVEVGDWTVNEKQDNRTRRGHIQVIKEGEGAGHFFQHGDGTPWLWIADTWWNWTQKKIKFETYKALVDDRAKKGFTLGQLFVPANGWGGTSSSLLDETYTLLDTAHMRKVENMIAYANSKGITVWVHGWWARKNLNETAGPEKMKRWWRYLIHRLGAYNVIWVIGGEYNMNNYGGLGLDFWKELGQFIEEEDAYDRIISAHNTPPGWEGGAEAPQWSTAEVLHDEPWLDYNQSQVGHGRWYNEMIPDVVGQAYAKTPAKPIVVTEPWYEFVEGNPTARDIRLAIWGAMMSGAAGHTYGGGHVWLAHLPESPAGGGPWPLEKSFDDNTLDYAGAMSMQHMATFYKDIQWWRMKPHADRVHEYPDKYCTAVPGETYVVYLRWGGTVKVDLRPSSENNAFEYRWFNPDTGKFLPGKIVKGGDIRSFASPGSYPGTLHFQDWVLHIRKVED